MRHATALLVAALLSALGCQPAEGDKKPKPRIPDVTVSQPVTMTLPDFEFTGETQAVDMVTVRAKVGGTVKKILFKEGEEVKKGDPLVLIDPETYELEVLKAKAELLRNEKAMSFQEKEMKRNELLAKDALSRSEYDKSVAALGIAIAEVKAAQAKLDLAELNLQYATVRAEIDGTVGSKLVTEGNLVSGGSDKASALTTIVYLKKIYAIFYVDERTAQIYRRDHPEERKPYKEGDAKRSDAKRGKVELALNTDGNRFPYVGVIDYVDSYVDPNTGTIMVRAIFDNADRWLLPGFTVRLRIYNADGKPSLVISERALLADRGKDFVYVINDKNVADRRFLKVGRKIGGIMTIDDGLTTDDWIIVYGLQRVRPGVTVKPEKLPMPDVPVAEKKSK